MNWLFRTLQKRFFFFNRRATMGLDPTNLAWQLRRAARVSEERQTEVPAAELR